MRRIISIRLRSLLNALSHTPKAPMVRTWHWGTVVTLWEWKRGITSTRSTILLQDSFLRIRDISLKWFGKVLRILAVPQYHVDTLVEISLFVNTTPEAIILASSLKMFFNKCAPTVRNTIELTLIHLFAMEI